VKPLPRTFRIGGWDFTTVERIGDVVLLRKVHPDVTRPAYEVAIVQKHETYTIGGCVVEAHEAMPGTEAFGRLAWAPSSFDAARRRFAALVAARGGGAATPAASEAPDASTGQGGPNDPVFGGAP
jgi:hypothetical protein